MTYHIETTITCTGCKRLHSDKTHRQCQKCRTRKSKSQSEKRNNFLRSGLCAKCGKSEPIAGFTLCDGCSLRQSRINRKRKDNATVNNLCNACGLERDTRYRLCSVCREKGLARRNITRVNRLKVGVCIRCGRNRLRTKNHCSQCIAYFSRSLKQRRELCSLRKQVKKLTEEVERLTHAMQTK